MTRPFRADHTANATVEIECVNMKGVGSVPKGRPAIVLHMGEDADALSLDATRVRETSSFALPMEVANDANLMGATSLPSVDHSSAPLMEAVVAALWTDVTNRHSPQPSSASSTEGARNAHTTVATRWHEAVPSTVPLTGVESGVNWRDAIVWLLGRFNCVGHTVGGLVLDAPAKTAVVAMTASKVSRSITSKTVISMTTTKLCQVLRT